MNSEQLGHHPKHDPNAQVENVGLRQVTVPTINVNKLLLERADLVVFEGVPGDLTVISERDDGI